MALDQRKTFRLFIHYSLFHLLLRSYSCISKCTLMLNSDQLPLLLRYSLFRVFFLSRSFVNRTGDIVFICPIAIAYSYGTDNKIGLRLSLCLSVCPCVITLTVAFLCRFSPNLTQRCKPPKVSTSWLGVNIVPPLFLFYP